MTRDEAAAELDRRARLRATAAGVPEGLRAPAEHDQARIDQEAMRAAAAAELERRKTPGTVESGARGAMQVATLGFADEASAAIEHGIAQVPLVRDASAWLSEKMGEDPELARRQANPDVTYSERRDQNRERDALGLKHHPTATIGGNILGGLIPGGALGAARGWQAVKGAAAIGAASGAGTSEADLIKGDVAGAAKDTAIGAGVGALVGGAAEGVKAGAKYVGNKVVDGIKKRIIDEIKDEVPGKLLQKQVTRAGNNIADEVITGPDSTAVRGAWNGDPDKGRAAIRPIIEKIGNANDAAYETFERAGRGNVPIGKFHADMTADAQEMRAAGANGGKLADAIEAYRDNVITQAQKAQGLEANVLPLSVDMRQLRGLTTGAQEAAATTLGALAPNVQKKITDRVSQIASERMGDAITSAASGDPLLTKTAEIIRANNRRFNALLTVDNVLKQRADAVDKKSIIKAITGSAGTSALGGTIGAMSDGDMEEKAKRAAQGVAIGATLRSGIPALARAGKKAITTAAINATKGGSTAVSRAATAESIAAATRIAKDPAQARQHLHDAIFGEEE